MNNTSIVPDITRTEAVVASDIGVEGRGQVCTVKIVFMFVNQTVALRNIQRQVPVHSNEVPLQSY